MHRTEFTLIVRPLLILIAVLFLSLSPVTSAAQQVSTILTYQGSVTLDEDDKEIAFPEFVYEDPERGDIYIVDGKRRILVYTNDFFPFSTLGRKKGVYLPQGITMDSNGNLYVTQAGTTENPQDRITVFDSCLQLEREIYLEGLNDAQSFNPYRIAADRSGNLFVASRNFPGILVLDSNDTIVDIISPEEKGKKVNLDNVTIDKDGKIYLLSQVEGRIYVYDSDRKFLFKFGERGGSTGKLSRPRAVAVDSVRGRMYVVDYMRHTVSSYDKKGAFLFEFGGRGWGEGWFQHPVDIFVDSRGRILVADFFNQRVEVFKSWEQGEEESITGKPILISKEIPQ